MVEDMPPAQASLWLQSHFIFSVIWSMGGNTDEAGRARFNTLFRGVLTNSVPEELALWATGTYTKVQSLPPDTRSVYDFLFDKEKGKWEFWLNSIESKPLDPDAEYSNIIVPTVDTIRYEFLQPKHGCSAWAPCCTSTPLRGCRRRTAG